MTVREYKKIIAAIDEADDDCLVITPVPTDLPGIFAFESVCPGISGMIELGPSPDWIAGSDANNGKPMRALLVAPHSYHDEGEHENIQEKLN